MEYAYRWRGPGGAEATTTTDTNTALTREIEVLTKEIHERVLGDLATNPATATGPRSN